MSFVVTLELPDICEGADFPNDEPTPLDAVEAFVAAVEGSPDLWVYRVREEGGAKRCWVVDLAGGPSIREVDSFSS
jgi:hypothetical protein